MPYGMAVGTVFILVLVLFILVLVTVPGHQYQYKKHRPLTFHPFVGSRPLSDWHAIWGVEWYSERNHPCQISCWSVMGFLGGRTPKSAIFYSYWNDPYNSPALPCRLWYVLLVLISKRTQDLRDRFSPNFHRMVGTWWHWKITDLTFHFQSLKGRCHGNEF